MFKKIILSLTAFVFIFSFALNFTNPVGAVTETDAEITAPVSDNNSTIDDIKGGGTLLGFPAWYRGSCMETDSCKGKSVWDNAILPVAANILEIAFRLIGILAIAYIIYGGFLYITSNGDPGKAKNGQTAITRAVVGLIIAMSATAIINFIYGYIKPAEFAQGSLSSLLSIVYFIAGALAVTMITYSGVQFVLSSGDPGKATRARQNIVYSIIGLIIVIGAYAITNFVVGNPTLNTSTVPEIFKSAVAIIFYFTGLLSVCMMIYSGIRYVTSAGNPAAVSKAGKTITYSVVGLMVSIFAYALVNFVIDQIT